MMNPSRRQVLIGLGSTAAAGGAVFGTTAFTTVTATRTAQVNVVGDDAALLALEPIGPGGNEVGDRGQSGNYSDDQTPTNPENPYVDFNDDELVLDLGDGDGSEINDEGATGVNPNARTVIRQLFRITNQGTQKVGVTITPVYAENGAPNNEGDVLTFFDNADGGNDLRKVENAVTIEPGESFDVSLEVDTQKLNDGESINLEEVTIEADVDNSD